MKKERIYAKIIVSPKGERHADSGHPWVYDNDITKKEGTYENGDLVDVIGESGKYLGTGFVNDHSKIRVRILSTNANDKFDEEFYKRRLEYAWKYRKSVMGDDAVCCRIIFGEADQFPGLTVDRFENILVAQTLSLGIEKIKPLLFRLLVQILKEDGQDITAVYERNDIPIRKLEGMEESKGFFPLEGQTTFPKETFTYIVENGIKYKVDYADGQKTGFFLDQKFNRLAVSQIAQGKMVLDCFTHTGSFALNALKGGATMVHCVDISDTAVEMAKENAALNHMDDKMEYEVANVFDLLPKLANEKQTKYDFIILDPPAFTKSRSTIKNAERGYKEINFRAMKILPRGGYLATCSCSHFMGENAFLDMIKAAAKDANVELRQIESRKQSKDHPIALSIPETDYLKFYLFQIV